MESRYTVPIIPYNLSKNETVIQVAEVLDHLSKVTESLLGRINERVENSNKKLLDISGRIDVVNSKINRLSGAKKATQVFSSSKYPAADLDRQYVSLFADLEPPKLVRNKVKHTQFVTNDEPLEKLHVYHVKNKSTEEKVTVSGLGDTPRDITFVNDVLLYNSGKNLYKHFVISDALDVSQHRKEQEPHEVSNLEPAPVSISERSNLNRLNPQPYFYSPDLGEVPALELPIDLPDLPGIADDLRYEIEEGPGIAPSVASTPHIPDLPAIEPSNPDEIKEQVLEINLPPPPSVIDTRPKEEPKQIKVVENVAVEQHNKQPEQISPTVPDVKLPPPPSQLPEIKERNPVNIPETTNIHASLMEAIRNAGGAKNAKLKTIGKEDTEVKKTASSGDLMADLHAKLSMRRKGISGTKKQENTSDGSSAMEKISAMIPPPLPKGDVTESTNTEDEEWDE